MARPRKTAPADTAVAYLRVSTEDQAKHGHGLDAQRDALTAYAETNGLTIVAWCVDDGVSSGRKMNMRPALQDALGLLSNRRVERLIAAKYDRLTRSVLEGATLMERAQREGWKLTTLDQLADMTTIDGEFAANLQITFAQRERRIIGKRTREGLAAAKARGVQLGKPTQLSDETLRRIIHERNEGRSANAIAVGLTADGVLTGGGAQRWQAVQVQRAVSSQRALALAALDAEAAAQPA